MFLGIRILTVVGGLVLPLAAQTWPRLTSGGTWGPHLVYDQSRQRMVAFGNPIREWGGTRWFETHVPYPPAGVILGSLLVTYDAARRHLLVLYGPNTWSYDGARWQLLAAYNPSQYDGSTRDIVYDPIRQVVVYANPFPGRQATYEWNGSAWRTISGGTPISLGLGFDPVRGQVVAFTPIASGAAYAWDGNTWNPIPGAVLPQGFPEKEPTLFTDPVRNRLIAYGGVLNNQVLGTAWAWDGQAWTAIAQGPPRWRAGVATDPVTGDWLLYGGSPTDTQFKFRDETWVFDTAFHRVEGSPVLDRIATDPVRRRIVGRGTEGTWEWDGVRWDQKTTASPVLTDMIYDPVRGLVVGLENDFSLPVMRTWLWDGVNWQLQNPATTPPWQVRQAAAWDPMRQVILIYGLQGTWEWDGFTWLQRHPAQSPPRRWNTPGTAGFDPWTQRTVLLMQNGAATEEWEWDGNDWLRTTTTGVPAWAEGGRMAVDPRSNRFLYVDRGGTWSRRNGAWTRVGDGNGNSERLAVDPFTDLLRSYGWWAGYEPELATVVLYGSGCGGPSLSPQGRPHAVGGHLRLDLGGAAPASLGAVYAGFAQASTPVGNGCTVLLNVPVQIGNLLLTNSAGFASLPVAIPAQPSLRGLEVWFQGVVLQAGGPLGGIAALTNGVRVHVGD